MDYTDKIAGIYKKLLVTSPGGVLQNAQGDIFVRCPKCLNVNPLQDHGLRVMSDDDGEYLRSQSWCRKCRGPGNTNEPEADDT